MNALQEKIWNTMTVFDALCEREHLAYYMLGGTMLGAYRHQGFIPWDDDMDIGLPRKDYEKLLALPDEKLPEGYGIRNHRRERGIPYTFTHFEDKNTTYIESRRAKDSYAGGVYLEIFPLDAGPDSPALRRVRDWKVRYYKRILYGLILDYGQKKRTLLRGTVIRLIRLLFDMDHITKKLDQYLIYRSNGQSRYLCNPLGHWGIRENIKREVFGKPVRYAFEGGSFFGVADPVSYLESLYGPDFMTPPAEAEKEKGKHPAYVMDLHLPYEEYQRKRSR